MFTLDIDILLCTYLLLFHVQYSEFMNCILHGYLCNIPCLKNRFIHILSGIIDVQYEMFCNFRILKKNLVLYFIKFYQPDRAINKINCLPGYMTLLVLGHKILLADTQHLRKHILTEFNRIRRM